MKHPTTNRLSLEELAFYCVLRPQSMLWPVDRYLSTAAKSVCVRCRWH